MADYEVRSICDVTREERPVKIYVVTTIEGRYLGTVEYDVFSFRCNIIEANNKNSTESCGDIAKRNADIIASVAKSIASSTLEVNQVGREVPPPPPSDLFKR